MATDDTTGAAVRTGADWAEAMRQLLAENLGFTDKREVLLHLDERAKALAAARSVGDTTGPVPSEADWQQAMRTFMEDAFPFRVERDHPFAYMYRTVRARAKALAAARSVGGDDAWLAECEEMDAALTAAFDEEDEGAMYRLHESMIKRFPRLLALVRASREPRASALTAAEEAVLAHVGEHLDEGTSPGECEVRALCDLTCSLAQRLAEAESEVARPTRERDHHRGELETPDGE